MNDIKIHTIVTFLIIAIIISIMSGCVERLITITSEPEGAVVWLNDEEVGATPVTVPFTWYGDYDITIRKDGYEPVHSSRQTAMPFYQWPGIDFFAETLLPVTLKDEHKWSFYLHKSTPADPDRLVQRAEALRRDVLSMETTTTK